MHDKNPEHWEWIDNEARKTFYERVGAGTLKCLTGFNHYGCRDEKLNKGLVTNKCHKCNEIENWRRVILYEGVEDLKEKHILNFLEGINRVKNVQHL